MDPRLNDLLPTIFEMLPQRDKFAFGQVCKQWRGISFRYTKKLDFSKSPFHKIRYTDEKLEYFLKNYRYLTSLSKLYITDRYDITDRFSAPTDAFAIIAQNCERIEEIDVLVYESDIREGSMALLANHCSKLKSFSAGFCTRHSDEDGFVSLVEHGKLERLSVTGFWGPSTWLKHIHSPLRSLSLTEVEFDPGDLIEGLRNVTCTLTKLDFLSSRRFLTEQELQTVMDLCPGVVGLSFGDFPNNTYGDWLLRSILRWARLEELKFEIYYTPLSDSFIESLVSGCPKLRKLNIEFHRVSADDELTEIGFSLLGRLKELTHLTLIHCQPSVHARCITDFVLVALKNPKLKELSVPYYRREDRDFVTDHGCIEVLANCPRLELLDIQYRCVTTQTIRAARSILLADQTRPKLTIFVHGTDVVWEPWFDDSVLKKRLTVHCERRSECGDD